MQSRGIIQQQAKTVKGLQLGFLKHTRRCFTYSVKKKQILNITGAMADSCILTPTEINLIPMICLIFINLISQNLHFSQFDNTVIRDLNKKTLAVTKTNLRSCKTSPFTFCLWLDIHTPTHL